MKAGRVMKVEREINRLGWFGIIISSFNKVHHTRLAYAHGTALEPPWEVTA